jgi:hypothetical protein
MTIKKLLHVGCGPKRIDRTSHYFRSGDWQETRLDIDLAMQPDVIGSLTDMSAVASGSMQAVFSSNNIEHLYPHEVPIAVAEMRRVLDAEGVLIVTCPDIQSIARLVADDKLLEPAYQSPAGPIAPLDMLYGHRPAMARGNLFMAHRCGFTLKVLLGVLHQAGFKRLAGLARPEYFDLWAVATVDECSDAAMRSLLLAQFGVATEPGAVEN